MGQVEWLVTRHFIDRYLFPGARILEVGAGTGRYALHYARQGHEVDAVELVQANLDVLHQHTQPGDRIRAVQGNALDLSTYPDQSFDRVLVLGPMYHLFSQEDKLRCLGEAFRVCKRGGMVYVAYCLFDPSMIQTAFMRGAYGSLVDMGLLDPQTITPISDPTGIFELYRKPQIDALSRQFDWERLHYVGTDMFAHYMRQQLDEMDEKLFEQFVRYTLSICENPDLAGVSNHVLDVLHRR